MTSRRCSICTARSSPPEVARGVISDRLAHCSASDQTEAAASVPRPVLRCAMTGTRAGAESGPQRSRTEGCSLGEPPPRASSGRLVPDAQAPAALDGGDARTNRRFGRDIALALCRDGGVAGTRFYPKAACSRHFAVTETFASVTNSRGTSTQTPGRATASLTANRHISVTGRGRVMCHRAWRVGRQRSTAIAVSDPLDRR